MGSCCFKSKSEGMTESLLPGAESVQKRSTSYFVVDEGNLKDQLIHNSDRIVNLQNEISVRDEKIRTLLADINKLKDLLTMEPSISERTEPGSDEGRTLVSSFGPSSFSVAMQTQQNHFANIMETITPDMHEFSSEEVTKLKDLMRKISCERRNIHKLNYDKQAVSVDLLEATSESLSEHSEQIEGKMKIEEFKKVLSEKELEISTLAQRERAMTDQIDGKEKRIEALETEITNSHVQIASLQNDIEKLKEFMSLENSVSSQESLETMTLGNKDALNANHLQTLSMILSQRGIDFESILETATPDFDTYSAGEVNQLQQLLQQISCGRQSLETLDLESRNLVTDDLSVISGDPLAKNINVTNLFDEIEKKNEKITSLENEVRKLNELMQLENSVSETELDMSADTKKLMERFQTLSFVLQTQHGIDFESILKSTTPDLETQREGC